MNIPEIPYPFLDPETFAALRPAILPRIILHKAARRFPIGPDVTAWAESPLTVWWQIQEMVRIEGGGFEQLQEELDAYRPLLPYERADGSYFFTMTLMVEIADAQKRKSVLNCLHGLEDSLYLDIGETPCRRIPLGLPDDSRDKTSSVLFTGFVIEKTHADNLYDSVIGFSHQYYKYLNKIDIKKMIEHAKEQLVF